MLSDIHSAVVMEGASYRIIDARRAPGPKTRADLVARMSAITRSLAHRDARAVEAALLAIFAITKPAADDRADPEALAKIYAAALSDLPAWAILEACQKVMRGGGSSTVFAPSAPELHIMADGMIEPYQRERGKIYAILQACKQPVALVQPRAERPAVDDLKQRYGEDWGIKAVPRETDAQASERARREQRAIELEQRAFEAQCAAAGVDPHPADGTIPVSPTLIARAKEMTDVDG